jgi:hypothetical protein
MIMTFGRYKGRLVENIPPGYLLWCLDNVANLSPTLRDAMQEVLGIRVALPTTVIDTDMKELVKQCFRRAALRHHPDHGGSHERMLAVNEFYGDIVQAIDAVGMEVEG